MQFRTTAATQCELTDEVPCISWVQLRLQNTLLAQASWQPPLFAQWREVALYCLPICGLPWKDQRSGKDSVRSLLGKGIDGFLKATQGNTTVLVRHVADSRAVRQVCQMHGRKSQQGMQDVTVGRADPKDPVEYVNTVVNNKY